MKMKGFLTGKWLVAFILLIPRLGLTQPTSDEFNKLLQAIESLKAGQQALHDDLQAIKKLLSSRGTDRSPIRDIDTTVDVSDAFFKGDKQATLTLLEFTDYQ